MSKMVELKICLQRDNIDIACISETHFNDSLFEAEICIPGYSF